MNPGGALRAALTSGLAAVLLQACTASQAHATRNTKPALVIEGVVIRNELRYPVTDVMIEVPATGEFAGCGNVLPRTSCSNAFPGVDYRSNAVIVRWREHGVGHSTGEFVIEIPDHARPGEPAVVEVIIFAPGEAGARLVQR